MKQYDYIVYKTTDLKTGLIYIGYDSYNRLWYYGSGTIMRDKIHGRFKDYIENIIVETFEEMKSGIKIEYKKKYGDKLFSKEILQHYETKEEMIKDEPNWIKKFNATNKEIGYNILDTETYGDTWTNYPDKEERKIKISKECYQYILIENDIIIKEYKSITIAINKTGIHSISACCLGKQKTAGGCYWSFEKITNIKKLNLIKEIIIESIKIEYLPKKVYQNSLDGNIFNKEYTSRKNAAKYNRLKQEKISACCNGHRKSIGGSIWSNYPLTRNEIDEIIKNRKGVSKKVGQFDKNNNLIEKYKSVAEAMRITGAADIYNCCTGRTKFSGGSMWRYLE